MRPRQVETGSTYGIPAIKWDTNEDGTQVVTSFEVSSSSTVSKTFRMMNVGSAALHVDIAADFLVDSLWE